MKKQWGELMKQTEAQKRASQRWSEKIDRLTVRLKKGMGEVVQEHAEMNNESVNAFVNRAIVETMERDKRLHRDKSE